MLTMSDAEYWSAALPENERWLSKPRPGVQFVSVMEPDGIVEGCDFPPRPKTVAAAVQACQELVGIHGPENVIGICAFKDKPAGVRELNDAIRAAQGFDDPMPRVGELLMITKNRSDALNGQRYRAIVIDADRKQIAARLIGASHKIMLAFKPHMRGPCKDVDWGYVATVHKYQGSEATAVLTVIPSGTLKLMKAVGGESEPWFFDRSCAYTACSRRSCHSLSSAILMIFVKQSL